jgi:hypothetical protein
LAAKGLVTQLLVLRHENAVLRRQRQPGALQAGREHLGDVRQRFARQLS